MRNTSIAENIAAGRRELGVTQAALAERVGVTKAAVSKWEKGPVDSPSIQGGAGRSVIALILASTALQAFAFAVPGGCPYPGSSRWREGASSLRACGVGY